MKKLLATLLAAVVLFCLLAPTIGASEAEDPFRESTFSISIYNENAQDYALENKTLTASGITIFRTINLLKQRDLILNFTQDEKELLEVRYYVIPESEESEAEASSDAGFDPLASPGMKLAAQGDIPPKSTNTLLTPALNVASLRADDVNRFYVKRNGQLVTGSGLHQYLRDGDIIEWVYGIPPEASGNSISTPSGKTEAISPTVFWTDTIADTFGNACSWLSRNPSSQSLYLTALGCAGKTAETKMVLELMSRAKAEYADAPAQTLALYGLNLSYCGYDRSDSDMANLLSRLTAVPFTSEDGLVARAYTLLALDCRNYTVPNAAEHNRTALVEEILSFQQKDGGFSAHTGSSSEVDPTALAITALASYRKQDAVASAVEKALTYLSNAQLESGNFKNEGVANSKSAAFTVTALCALGVRLDDGRFTKNNKNPLDILLEYEQADGGFSMAQDGSSTSGATEAAIIALSAVKRNGNPLQVPASLATAPTIAPQEKIPATTPEAPILTTYAVVGGICLAAIAILTVLLIRYLRRNRNASVAAGTQSDTAAPIQTSSTASEKEGSFSGNGRQPPAQE